jgi:hypothetical protein
MRLRRADTALAGRSTRALGNMHGTGSPRGWLVASGAVLLASVLAVWVQSDVAFLGFSLRPVAVDFAYPGTTIWWLTLGGPFQVAPRSLSGGSTAAIANAAFWLGIAKLGALTIRSAARRFGRLGPRRCLTTRSKGS